MVVFLLYYYYTLFRFCSSPGPGLDFPCATGGYGHVMVVVVAVNEHDAVVSSSIFELGVMFYAITHSTHT